MEEKLYKEEILIVDDEQDVRFLLSRILKKKGFEPKTCSTLSQCKKEIAMHDYDIILLDINLTDGNGLSLLEDQLIPESAKVVVMSARNDMAELALALGASHFISKPFTGDKLIEILCK